MTAKILKTIIYARVSTSHHDQRPEVQINELRRFCMAREWEATHEIVDHGYTGSTDNRPGLKKLLTLARSREVDAIVVLKLDRLFRSLRHLVTTLEEFQSLGITFVAVKDQVDYSSPAGRFFVQILGSLAEFEKALLRERTMMGLDHARSLGKRLGRPKTTNEEAIVELRAQGLSHTEIQKRLKVSKGAVWRALKSSPKSPSDNIPKTLINSEGEDDES
jgi:DNA invertase Pin-like site-specific DNA recombinase